MTALGFAGSRARTMVSETNRRDLLAGSLLLACTGVSQLLKPRRSSPTLVSGELEAVIPKTVGPLHFAASSGLVLPPKDELSDRLYDQVLTRVYSAAGSLPVFALVAYGSVQNLSLELHRPDECYPQQGFTITEPEPLPLQLADHAIPASVLTARRKGGYVEQVVFWSRIGTHFPASRSEQSWIVAQENFAGRMPDGVLIRLSVPSSERAAGVHAATKFLADLTQVLPDAGRQILFGEGKGVRV